MIYVGTAAWTIPKVAAELFPLEGSHLERYASVLNAVEINSSFYKDHMAKSYKRWKESTPRDFRFSVKLNRRFTHECNLSIGEEDLLNSLDNIAGLEEKWAFLLLQFPGKMMFDPKKMDVFYKTIRKIYEGSIALEARNLSWMARESVDLIKHYGIDKVMADPEKCPGILSNRTEYYRLHGSPEIYKSDYDGSYLDELYLEMKDARKDVWCIFDNTTFGHATMNAVNIMNREGDMYERRPRIYDNPTTSLHATYEH